MTLMSSELKTLNREEIKGLYIGAGGVSKEKHNGQAFYKLFSTVTNVLLQRTVL